jgi:hypothetical protein
MLRVVAWFPLHAVGSSLPTSIIPNTGTAWELAYSISITDAMV